ncbi:phage tail protein [Erythrobacter sp. SD-21]|uniref:phage tail protein n=1 Tax=Erythrobacter sp. SD-21 TaxID=161528 RepID=UPI000153F771|nr:phage tail protein [Erythrobacter sp. SD-21]EDL49047.1 hypothetical protein ED21_20244 [Erythrobacter sp. SD-21]
MATLVLSSVGRLFGPVGQIVGTLAGNAIDNALFGSNDIEGARLKELAVTGSSYGTPIARQFGQVRAPGTIVWATDLEEHREKHSNGKGQPKTVSYSYSVSFAVALSSGPIDRIGRIWADGNLLRGTAGDLKSAGTLRIYQGHGDQPCDPLLQAHLGDRCPGFRGQAFAVFEDLDLTDFGNRIPALSFEIFAGSGSVVVETLSEGEGLAATQHTRFPELVGYSYEGGPVRDIVRLIDRLHPLEARVDGTGVALTVSTAQPPEATLLPPAAAWSDGEFGVQAGYVRQRSSEDAHGFAVLRYYDPARDFQAGMQLAGYSEGDTRTFQFPGALSAANAQRLARQAATRARVRRDRMLWRCTQLDPDLVPGALVRAPGIAGIWQIAAWEWREAGIELELVRHSTPADTNPAADPGAARTPLDRLASATLLRVFEVPWDGQGSGNQRRAYAAADAPAGRWPGCALYALRDGALVPLDRSVGERAVTGTLGSALGPSHAVRFEPASSCVIDLANANAALASTDITGLAQGENRMLIGREIVQYRDADPLGDGRWHLSGLLRGRGGTEFEAAAGHAEGESVVLLDDRLAELSDMYLSASTGSFAAIGIADEEPALATLENAGASLRPPSPVHARLEWNADGSASLRWTRRARGQWLWPDEVDLPVVEETESYEVGYGPVTFPLEKWVVAAPWLQISSETVIGLLASHGSQGLWVRQIGDTSRSRAIALGTLA